MALNGVLQADFSQFVTAVFTAETKLKSFEAGAAKVESQLNKVTNSFSGVKIIQEATIAAEAVERIGGASALTASEQDRVNRTITEALAKYAALGQEAPAALRQLARETERVDDQTKAAGVSTINWKSALTSAAGLIGVTFSAGAVIAFGRHVFDAASEIHDMSERLGISTDAVQGFKFAAEQSGSTLDAVGIAINKMNDNLAGGNKATVQALSSVGLQFQDIRNMKPEDAFLAISDAIQRIPDPMTQADTAMALFGKSAAELLPGIKEGFRGAAASADKMSDDTIRDLEAAQDAWGRLADKVTIATGTIIAAVMRTTAQVTSSWGNAVKFLDDSIKFGVGGAAAMADQFASLSTEASKHHDINLPLATAIHKTAEEIASEKAAAEKAATALRAHAEAIQDISDKYNGNAIAKKVSDLAEAMRKLPASSNFGALATDIGKLFQEGAKLTPEMISLGIAFGTLTPKMIPVGEAFRDIGGRIDVVIPKVQAFGIAVTNSMIPAPVARLGTEVAIVMPKVVTHVHDAGKALGDLATAFSQLAQIAGDGLGSIVRSIATFVGALDTANKGMKSFSEGKAAFKDGDALAGILGMSTGILGIASAAIAAGKAIANMFDRNKGRDLVTDFADTFGGFDTLHIKLLELGESGEALWIKLTQGVGRNNPAQAQAVIDEVSDALAEQKRKQDAATVSTEAGAQATVETAAAAVIALDQVSGRLLKNADEWGEWSITVTGYLQQLADNIRALPMPSVSGSSVGAPFVAFPRTTPAASNSGALTTSDGPTFHVNLTMPDGDVLLRQVAIAARRNGLA